MKSLKSGFRTVDVARQAGYSVQQIRNLERDEVIPPASRTPSGYRSYSEAHVLAALAYRALAAATGPVEAKQIMRTAGGDEVFASLDAAHARIHSERLGLRLARQAADAIADEPVTDVRPTDSMTITELAAALGIRASTLRHWEAEGLVTPARSASGMRTYTPADVRDARIVHQLRQAGYRILHLATLMPQLRSSPPEADIGKVLEARESSLNARSRHLITATAVLDRLLHDRHAAPGD